MKFLQIWREPLSSSNGCTDVKFIFEGLDAKLILMFYDKEYLTIHFKHVVAYKHEENYLFLPNTTDFGLLEIVDSEWVNKIVKTLKELGKYDSYKDIKHFIYDNHNDGRFEVIAESCDITEHFALNN